MTYPETQIFYESPHRVVATLTNLLEVYGDRQVVLVRELTKRYEEYQRGMISELLDYLSEAPLKGECLLIVAGNDGSALEAQAPLLSPIEEVKAMIALGSKPNHAIKTVAKERGLARQALYQDYHENR